MCVGFEGDRVYCYGNDDRCLIGACSKDSDCSKYNTTDSPKHTEGGTTTCQDDQNLKYPTNWQHDACHCSSGIINFLLKSRFYVLLLYTTFY
jgi:hypothetical protein